MSWEIYLMKTPTNKEDYLSQVTETVSLPCWRELRDSLNRTFPDLISGYAKLDQGCYFPFLSSPDYNLEFNLGTASDGEALPIDGILFRNPGYGKRWAYPLKFLCSLLEARIVDCGSGEFWNWENLPKWIADGL